MSTLGNRIKKLRKEKGVSQSELGRLLGIKNTQISNYEKGVSVPPSDTLSMMADIFNCTTDYLLCRTDNISAYVTELNINGNNIKITSTKPLTENDAIEFLKYLIKK